MRRAAAMVVVPLELTEANAAVKAWHRHHKPVVGHRFSLGVIDDSGVLHGAAIVGRPVARLAGHPRSVAEVTRLVTDGTPNACSMLYAAAARACRALGFETLATSRFTAESVVIERIESYGMPVGREVFDTVLWAGRFAQAAASLPVYLLPRRAVKVHLCGNSRAKDANVRQALLDRYGGKVAAIGLKRTPGPLYGIHGDVWAALAVAVTFHDDPDLAEVLR